jgi:hypothetical protein
VLVSVELSQVDTVLEALGGIHCGR